LGRVQRAGARLDEKRLEWINGHFIRQMPPQGLYELSKAYWPAEAGSAPDDYKRRILNLLQERLKYLAEIASLSLFFFKEPSLKDVAELFNNPSDKQLGKVSKATLREFLKAAREQLAGNSFSEEDLANGLNDLLEKLQTKPGVLFAAIRIAISGTPASPQLFGTLSVLGKQKSVERIDRAITVLGQA
ncbi:MAG TPA: glutamate--tRNA ligase, partial [Candidatus Saccharimonadales bacterium]|nr:glutamate--tRNA ligase [Candidatus Saccharimonadales bacterium]